MPRPGLAVPKPAGHPADRSARGGQPPRSTTRPPGCSGTPSTSPSLRSGRTRASSTSRRCSTSPAGTSAGREPPPSARPTDSADRHRGALPAGAATPAEPGSLSDRGEPSNGASERLQPPARPAGARRAPTPAPWHPAGPRTTPGGRPAAGTSRSRSCAPSAQQRLEALVRSRRSPYLCKVERAGDFSIEAEVISACGFLDDDGIGCTLHGRVRADGRPAKPDLCSDWPPKNKGLHPGCVFAPRRRRARKRAYCASSAGWAVLLDDPAAACRGL